MHWTWKLGKNEAKQKNGIENVQNGKPLGFVCHPNSFMYTWLEMVTTTFFYFVVVVVDFYIS